jgi:hypothetical protein
LGDGAFPEETRITYRGYGAAKVAFMGGLGVQ